MATPKSIYAKRFFFVYILSLFSNCIFGQAGKDGSKTINSVNTIVNDYTSLTANANAGSSSIQVASNNLNAGFTSPLSAGDLIFIIQVQGATINTSDNPTYGSIISYQNCGNNEFAVVSSVSGSNTISLVCQLQFSYSTAGKTVVVRVPRFLTLSVNGGASLTCPAWNGTTGGIIAIEVLGITQINGGGSIDASGKGFRGGGLLDNNSTYGVTNYAWPTNDLGAEKGESIAGSVSDYDLFGGRYCKGAPANGGGGGNAHNTGGGGGANAGNISNYSGNGNPDISNASWSAAWNLESPGFATSSSSGGGKGGYSFSDSNQDALVVGPFNPAWSGEERRNSGGLGGHPLDYSSGKYFMGGGGGAGEQNEVKGGAGGAGGGIIYIHTYASISGSGQILANGATGFNTATTNGTDGAGGGGSGGTILLRVTGMINAITINANGGNGGSQFLLPTSIEAEGPGGGGGGGYIAVSGGSITRNANGGNNGITNSSSLNEFPPNGATKGGAGINNGTLSSFRILTQTINVCDSTSATITVTTLGTAPPGVVYYWYDQPTGSNVIGTGSTFTTPVITSPTTFYVGACPGIIRVAIQVNISSSISATFSSTTVCAGSSTNFTATGTAGINSWNWNFGDGVGSSTQQNPSYTYSIGGTYVATLTFSNGTCTRTTSQLVTVNNLPVAAFTTSATGSCGPLNVQFTNTSTSATGYSWDFGDGSLSSTQTNPSHVYSTGGIYAVVLTALGPGCSQTTSLTISAGLSPTASFSSNNNVCQSDSIFFTNLSNSNVSPIISYSWDFGDGSPFSTLANPSHFYLSPGIFSVKLTTSTAQCSDDTIITVNVVPGPIAAFNASNTSGCINVIANFNNTSTGTQTFTWNFGDGSALSNQTSPLHNYTNTGTYTVTLIATLGSCSDTLQQSNLIHVYNKPTSSFSATNVCDGDSVHFNNLSNDNGNPIISYQWTFGDGNSGNGFSPQHLYGSTGTYIVQLTANSANCFDDTTIAITVNAVPVAGFTSSVAHACDSATVQFSNTSTGANGYTWIFGDGDSSNAVTPSHTYSTPGTYSVSLTAKTSGGCSMTRISLNMITIHPTPSAVITTSANNICENECISFSSTPSPEVTGWIWTFSGGQPSSATNQDPGNICYQGHGNYDVTLEVTSGFCESMETYPAYIQVADCSSKPIAGFISSDTGVCVGHCIDFVDLSANAISWQWFFPGANPSTSAIENPLNVCYPNQGTFNVTLIAGNTAGYDTVTLNNFIQINPAPNIPTITQVGDTLISSASTFYQWCFNNVPVSGANAPVYIANLSGDYSVITSDANGCTATSSSKHVSLVGINELNQNLILNIYPNPVSDQLSVSFHAERPMKLLISLINVLGVRIFFENVSMISNEEIFIYSLKDLAQGMYFMQIESDEYMLIRPVLKQ